MLLSYTVNEDVGSVEVCVWTTGLPSGGLAADMIVNFEFMDSTKTSEYNNTYSAQLTSLPCVQVLMMIMLLWERLWCLRLDLRVMAAFSVSVSL